MVIDKLHLTDIDTFLWHLERSIKDWWSSRSGSSIPNRKVMASLTLLVSWSIWNKRNARVFRHKCAPTTVLLNMVIDEMKLWITVGSKHLGNSMTGEYSFCL